jgi:hypothetical protein
MSPMRWKRNIRSYGTLSQLRMNILGWLVLGSTAEELQIALYTTMSELVMDSLVHLACLQHKVR